VHCKAFEDNSGALEMAKTHKLRPRTKYINVKYHHFRAHVDKTITIHKIDTKDQLADGLTKPLDVIAFQIFRDRVMGYDVNLPTDTAERESEMKSGSSTGIKSSSSTGGHDKNGRSHRAGRSSTASTLVHQF
jgi:hypothetical protein